jgi:hypothetical protein
MIHAFAVFRVAPGARTFYDDPCAGGIEHSDALRRLTVPSRGRLLPVSA